MGFIHRSCVCLSITFTKRDFLTDILATNWWHASYEFIHIKYEFCCRYGLTIMAFSVCGQQLLTFKTNDSFCLWLLKFSIAQLYCQKTAKKCNCLWQTGVIFLFSYDTFCPAFHWIFLFHYCNVRVINMNDRHLSRSQVCHNLHTDLVAYTK